MSAPAIRPASLRSGESSAPHPSPRPYDDPLIELEVGEGELTVRSVGQARQGWEDRFRAMAEAGDDELLDAEAIEVTAWDEEEWEW